MAILGLLTQEKFEAYRFKTIRRSVFYTYPQGASPLLGLLSMLDSESLTDNEFSWWEKRMRELVSSTVVNGTTSGFWYADSSGSLGSALGTAAADKVAGTAYWIRVASITEFRGLDIIKIPTVTITGGTVEMQLKVLPNASGEWSDETDTGYVRVTPLHTQTAVTNAHTNNAGIEVKVLGNASSEAQVGSYEGYWTQPANPGNVTQIFRHPMKFSRNALKSPLKFDKTGPYKDKSKQTSIEHMTGMEHQFIFGDYSKSLNAQQEVTFTTGGVLFFLRLWEAGNGNQYKGVTNQYGNVAATQNSDDNKRIINIDGNITEDQMDVYFERLFRETNNVSNEKLAFVGSGFLSVINSMYRNKSVLQADFPSKEAYGMAVVKHVTPFGVIYWKTHPLFNKNVILRQNALFLDVQYMKYRYVEDADTQILKNRQENDADYRKDEFFTEAGLELQFPEAHMYMTGVQGVNP